MITAKRAVLCLTEDPSPIAYFNLYEEGDIWVKIQGCDVCPVEWRKRCCGNCPMVSEKGCFWHLENEGRDSSKPYSCMLYPNPRHCKTDCMLEFKCVAGNNKGKIRKIKDKRDVFQG